MPAFDLINVDIALAGDIRSVVSRAWPENPVTFPELEILKVVHGEGSLRNPTQSGETVTRTMAEERERLIGLYGDEGITKVFGGTAANLPTKAPDEIPKVGKKKSAKAGGREKPEEPEEESEPEPEPVEPEPEPEEEAPAEDEEFPPAPAPTVAKSKVKALPK